MIVHKSGKDDSFVGNFRRKFYRELSENALYHSLTNEWSSRCNFLQEFEKNKFTPRVQFIVPAGKNQRREKIIESLWNLP